MSMVGMILVWVAVAIVIVLMNNGPLEKECDRRRTYWSKFEGK